MKTKHISICALASVLAISASYAASSQEPPRRGGGHAREYLASAKKCKENQKAQADKADVAIEQITKILRSLLPNVTSEEISVQAKKLVNQLLEQEAKRAEKSCVIQ